MKAKHVEGTPDEITDLFRNEGMNLAAYLEQPEPPLHLFWVVLPSVLFVFCIIASVFTQPTSRSSRIGFAVSLCIGVWTCLSVHRRWKTSFMTGFAGVCMFLIAAVCYGLLPVDALAKLVSESQKKG